MTSTESTPQAKTEAKPQGQKLDGDNLQEVLDSAKNAADLGRQQFFTPLELAEILAIPLPYYRKSCIDLTSGDGALLKGCGADHALGCEIDSRLARKPDGAKGEWSIAHADVTKLYELLTEVEFRGDIFALNPPFSLKWDAARFAPFQESGCESVRSIVVDGHIDSTLATYMMALDLMTKAGEGYMICNEATARRFFGDPDGDALDAALAGSFPTLRSHIWLWVTLPPGVFPNTRDLTTAVIYFARDHSGAQPFHMVSPTASFDHIRILLQPMRSARFRLRKGTVLNGTYDCDPLSVSKWNAARHEYNSRYRNEKARPFNIWLEKGRIKRHLTPFQNYSGKLPRDLVATLDAIEDRTPMELVVNRDTRLALQRAVRSDCWRVDPSLVQLVDECVALYNHNRAPFYPLSDLMRLGFLDENDQIQARVTQEGFTAGEYYPIICSTVATERSSKVVNIFGEEQDVTLQGQELSVKIQGANGWVEFTEKPEDIVVPSPLGGPSKKKDKADARKLLEIADIFVIPDVPDVARAHPEKYAANLARIAEIEKEFNERRGTTGLRAFEYREYQRQDLARLAVHDGGILAWEPGLGKTLGMFTFPLIKGAKLNLIVAPDSLHEQIIKEAHHLGFPITRLESQEDFYADATLQKAWRDKVNGRPSEAAGWYIAGYTAISYNGADEWEGKPKNVPGPDGTLIQTIVVSDTLQKRRQMSERYCEGAGDGVGHSQHGILCVFRPTLATLCAEVFDCIECDEGVRIKSTDSCMSMGVRRMRPQFRAVMTGTPIKNRLDDIFWLAHWAAGGNEDAVARWPYPNTSEAKEEFANQHMVIERNHTREEKYQEKTGQSRRFEKRTPALCNVHRLWKLLSNVVVRRRKADIGEAIVPKTIVPIRVPAGAAQHAVYRFHCENPPEFTRSGKEMDHVAAIVCQLQNLRQAALCPDTPNLSWEHLSLHTIRAILEQEAGIKRAENVDEHATRRAVLAITKGEATPFPGEAKVALEIVEKMIKGNAKIDLQAIFAAAPNLSQKLKVAVDEKAQEATVDGRHPNNARSWTDFNPKQATCLRLIEELIGKGEQVVVMSPFTHFSATLARRLEEAGVSVCLLDGFTSPKKRGAIAAEFKRQKYAVMVAGILSMGEGHSFECASHLILPSIDWAYDKNRQAEDRIHRLTSRKPCTIYALATNNTVDVRLQSLYAEKGDSSCLALDGRILAEETEEMNIGQLLRDAITNFDEGAETIPEQDIEKEWETSLRARLRLAEKRFREWHPPTVRDSEGYRPMPKTVRKAVAAAGLAPMVTIAKAVPDATFGALIGSKDPLAISQVKRDFLAFCEKSGHTDWRRAWSAFDATRKPAERSPAALAFKSDLSALLAM